MRMSQSLCRDIYKQIEAFSKFNPSPLSIKKFIDFGRSASDMDSFLFLRKELPVRLANIMQEIHLLPENLLRMPSVTMVQSWYERSFEEILTYEHKEAEQNVMEQFCLDLIKIRNRHSNVVPTMAQGVLEMKETHQVDQQTEHSIQYFLHRFYMSRIGIRMLINQHATLFGRDMDVPLGHVGVVDPNCDVIAVAKDAYENARFLCEQYYLTAPDLVINTHNSELPTSSITFTYVPSHLHHILFELFKNSMRAIVEQHGDDGAGEVPAVQLMIVKGKEDLSMKISDRGGGIPRSLSDQLFHYMYSTAPKPPAAGGESVPLAGFGYGLPLSRLYARYFHGDLVITSYEGYGTDATVFLKVLESEANELLPVFNRASFRRYKASMATHDWSSNQGGPQTNQSGSSAAADQSLGVQTKF